MKMLKYLLLFVLFIGLGISAWLYYPQYQINKMKKQTVEVSKDATNMSYINYYRNAKAEQIHHLALGDSIIRGFGAPENENLGYQFSIKLESQIDKKIEFQNEGINGITSDELRALVQEGRFDDQIKNADIVTISVGGNDILRMAKRQNFQTVFQTFNQLQSTFSKNLTDIAERINMLNPDATIVFLELYNPLSPESELYPLADQLLPKWNLLIYEVADRYPSSLVVETTKVINGEKRQHLSADGVHPNSAGYTAISEQMLSQFKHQYKKEPV